MNNPLILIAIIIWVLSSAYIALYIIQKINQSNHSTLEDVENRYKEDILRAKTEVSSSIRALIVNAASQRMKERTEAFTNPNNRSRYLYSVGCMRCNTPLEKGIGNCRGCKHFLSNNKLKNLKT